jgi:hypothetical protein
MNWSFLYIIEKTVPQYRFGFASYWNIQKFEKCVLVKVSESSKGQLFLSIFSSEHYQQKQQQWRKLFCWRIKKILNAQNDEANFMCK